MKPATFLRGACGALLYLVMSVAMAQTSATLTRSSGSGSKNMVIPPSSGDSGATPLAPRVIRHPTQAGKVSATVSGNFVPSAGLSWIAKGDTRYSLCATTKANTVACSPLVAASVIQGLEVGTIIGRDGLTSITFTPEPGKQYLSKTLAQGAGIFMQRIAKMAAHLEREAVSFAPRPRELELQFGREHALLPGDDTACGGRDETGAYDCRGGSGSEGGGGDWGGGGGWGGCNGSCDYPGGNDNGNPPPPGVFDPSTGEGLDPNAPEVVIVGRPEQGTVEPPYNWRDFSPSMPAPEIVPMTNDLVAVVHIPGNCVPGPRFTVVCPPPAASPFTIPRAPRGSAWKWKWSDFQWCKVWNNCAPIANEAEQSRPPPVTREERFSRAMEACAVEAKGALEYCKVMREVSTIGQNKFCETNALENYKACELLAIDQLHNH